MIPYILPALIVAAYGYWFKDMPFLLQIIGGFIAGICLLFILTGGARKAGG